jgi:hypothetical protein
MPHVPHESMSNASTVAFFQRHVVEYMAQDYQFNQEVTARYTFQDEIAVARDGFLESVRDKRLVDSFSFDLSKSRISFIFLVHRLYIFSVVKQAQASRKLRHASRLYEQRAPQHLGRPSTSPPVHTHILRRRRLRRTSTPRHSRSTP